MPDNANGKSFEKGANCKVTNRIGGGAGNHNRLLILMVNVRF